MRGKTGGDGDRCQGWAKRGDVHARCVAAWLDVACLHVLLAGRSICCLTSPPTHYKQVIPACSCAPFSPGQPASHATRPAPHHDAAPPAAAAPRSLFCLDVEHERVLPDVLAGVPINQFLAKQRPPQHLAPRPQPVACREGDQWRGSVGGGGTPVANPVSYARRLAARTAWRLTVAGSSPMWVPKMRARICSKLSSPATAAAAAAGLSAAACRGAAAALKARGPLLHSWPTAAAPWRPTGQTERRQTRVGAGWAARGPARPLCAPSVNASRPRLLSTPPRPRRSAMLPTRRCKKRGKAVWDALWGCPAMY